jgi:hypothetical protein
VARDHAAAPLTRAASARRAAAALALVGAFVGAFVGVSPGRAIAAESPSAAVAFDEIDTAIQKLGTCPEPAEVLALVRRTTGRDASVALRVIAALVQRPGHGASRGLVAFVPHADAATRAAALRGIADMRIRHASGMDDVRAACRDLDAAVRAAAYAALGAIGDGSDVPLLLDTLSSQDAANVASAYAALRELTGSTLPYQERVWRQWWKETKVRAPAQLAEALACAESADTAAAKRLEAIALVAADAWIDVPAVTTRAAGWTESADATLRAIGYGLLAKLRAGDFAEHIARGLALETDADVLRLGAACAASMAIRIERRAEPSRAK